MSTPLIQRIDIDLEHLYNRLDALERAVDFLDQVRQAPSDEKAIGVYQDALEGLEEAARKLVKE